MVEKYKEHGKKWTKLAACFPNRTVDSVRNKVKRFILNLKDKPRVNHSGRKRWTPAEDAMINAYCERNRRHILPDQTLYDLADEISAKFGNARSRKALVNRMKRTSERNMMLIMLEEPQRINLPPPFLPM